MVPITTIRLPPLGSFLRLPPKEAAAQVLTLWDLQKTAGLITLPPQLAQKYSRLTHLDEPAVDAAYCWVLGNIPEVAKGCPVTAEYLQASQGREAALDALGEAATTLTAAMVDNQYLLRAGLYGICVRTEERMAERLRQAGTTSQGQWARLYLEATWSVAEEQEGRPQERAAETRKRQKKAQEQVLPILARTSEAEGHRQAIERLLELAGVLAPPPRDPQAVAAGAAPLPLTTGRDRALTKAAGRKSTRR